MHQPTPTSTPIPAPRFLDEHADPPTDAIAIVQATIADGHVPFGVSLERIERAISYAVVCIRRRTDEHAPTIASVNRAIDQLASTRRAILANDADIARRFAALKAQWEAEDLAAQAQTVDQNDDPNNPDLDRLSPEEIAINVLRSVLQRKTDDPGNDGGQRARLRPRPKTDPHGPNGTHAEAPIPDAPIPTNNAPAGLFTQLQADGYTLTHPTAPTAPTFGADDLGI